MAACAPRAPGSRPRRGGACAHASGARRWGCLFRRAAGAGGPSTASAAALRAVAWPRAHAAHRAGAAAGASRAWRTSWRLCVLRAPTFDVSASSPPQDPSTLPGLLHLAHLELPVRATEGHTVADLAAKLAPYGLCTKDNGYNATAPLPANTPLSLSALLRGSTDYSQSACAPARITLAPR